MHGATAGAADSRPKNQENDWRIPEIFLLSIIVYSDIGRVGGAQNCFCAFSWAPHCPKRKERNKVYGDRAPRCSTSSEHSSASRAPCAPIPEALRLSCPVFQLAFRPPWPLCDSWGTSAPGPVLHLFYGGSEFIRTPWKLSPFMAKLTPSEKLHLNKWFMGLLTHLYKWALARATTRHFLDSKCVALWNTSIIQWDRFTHFLTKTMLCAPSAPLLRCSQRFPVSPTPCQQRERGHFACLTPLPDFVWPCHTLFSWEVVGYDDFVPLCTVQIQYWSKYILSGNTPKTFDSLG